jgi:predicted CoA-substrate-specific enzyme activase
MKYYIGIDIGSISQNIILMDDEGRIIEEFYDYGYGKPFHQLLQRLDQLFLTYPERDIQGICFTGNGGKKGSELMGGAHINEIIAQSTAVAALHPEVRTVIEMGGEDAKLIFMDRDDEKSHSSLSDFSMNSLCAAGTGSFLDQQAKRLGIRIEKEFGELALKSAKPPRIAGRCSVFAKSDMIHLQQVATPMEDIIAGLCFAVARNLKSTLGRGKHFTPPVMFQGGVAANAGMVRAFREVLGLDEKQFRVPDHFASMGAIGAILYTRQHSAEKAVPYRGLEPLRNYLNDYEKPEGQSLMPLTAPAAEHYKEVVPLEPGEEKTPVYLGVDVGSLSTNVVLINRDNQVVARRYLPTAGQPLNAIRRGLKEIHEEVGDRVSIRAAGTTGSGRYLTGDFIGADSIQNEITAQATATIYFDPKVDTIFEIGGQDSKYIRVENGVIVDFEMNKVCAAGTGSFLEEQAERLDINIVKEFEKLAFESPAPAKLGERCTVFMESDLNSCQQKGEAKENLVAGLAYSTVLNYLNRVVGDKPVGEHIYYQGGVTNNKAVVSAFEQVTGKPIHIPPHFDITGAIGAAMLARDRVSDGQPSRFKGFHVSEVEYTTQSFVCDHCSNHCEIHEVRVDGEAPLFYGGICDRYETDERKGMGKDIPNLFEERTRMLLDGYDPGIKRPGPTIGVPRELTLFYQNFPFWRTLLEEMGFNVVISKESNKRMLTRSIEMMTCETCLPIEMMHGHVDDLMKKGVDYVFLPFVVNVKGAENNPTNNCNCPWIQAHPFMVKASYADSPLKGKILSPTFHLRYFDTAFREELMEFAKPFSIPKQTVKRAIEKADQAQARFEQRVADRGKEVLANLPPEKKVFVIVGRSYNTSDPALNLSLAEKLRNLDILAVPIDYLPLQEENIFDFYPMMYWPNGQKILSAARIIATDDRLNAVYLGNFRCGPDSFLRHYVAREMNGKPYLHLEVDEHSANAGMITRIEAFIDSLEGYLKVKRETARPKETVRTNVRPITERTLYFPYANDVVWAFAGACRSLGMKAEVLPMQDETDLALARKYTNGQECFPLICTTGSFLKKLKEPGVVPGEMAFFMPDHNGPCRFGGYNKLQQIIFERLGFGEAMIIHPSNEDNYASIAPGNPVKWRMLAWRGLVAIDLIRKLLQQKRPYELVKGQSDALYIKAREAIVQSLSEGGKSLKSVLRHYTQEFMAIPYLNGNRRPIIAVVGEIFMRDNAFCSANMVRRLEALGAETLMAPFAEWISYSTYRYTRDSRWKKNTGGYVRSKIQGVLQHQLEHTLVDAVTKITPVGPMVRIEEMLDHCDQYIHRDYDGDPPLSLGTTSILSENYISGVVNILPFTCMPGTLNTSVSDLFRRDHDHLPWENFAYDGQEDSSLDSRLQAFMHQAREFCERKELNSLSMFV